MSGIFIYPEGWEAPPMPPNDTLSETDRALLKTKMKNMVNTANRPVGLKELVEYVSDWLRNLEEPLGPRHIHDREIKPIALEIREEHGYPGQEVPE